MNPFKAFATFVTGGMRAVKATTVRTLSLLSTVGWNVLGWGGATYQRLVTLALESPYASRGLRLIANTAASAPVVVLKRDGEKEAAVEDAPNLLALRRQWGEVTDAAVWGLYCGGRMYVERIGPTDGPNAGRVDRLRLWRADECGEVTRDAAGDPVSYRFTGFRGQPVAVEAERVLCLHAYDPKRARGEEPGAPILLGARRALVALESGDEWNRSLAASGGRIEGFFKPNPTWLAASGGTGLAPDTVEAAQDQVNAKMGESAKRGQWHVLNGAFDPVPASLTPKDADFLKKALADMEATACVLGVLPSLLAHPKAGSLTDAGIDSEVAALLKVTVLPFVRRRILQPLSEWLLPDGERFDVDESRIGVLGEDQDARWARYGKAYREDAIITREEARNALDLTPEPEVGAFPEAPEAAPPSGDGMARRDIPVLDLTKALMSGTLN